MKPLQSWDFGELASHQSKWGVYTQNISLLIWPSLINIFDSILWHISLLQHHSTTVISLETKSFFHFSRPRVTTLERRILQNIPKRALMVHKLSQTSSLRIIVCTWLKFYPSYSASMSNIYIYISAGNYSILERSLINGHIVFNLWCC